jgi:hypothetical protein
MRQPTPLPACPLMGSDNSYVYFAVCASIGAALYIEAASLGTAYCHTYHAAFEKID